MAIRGSYVFETVKKLHREKETLHFDHIVQRDYMWNDDHRSLFIHSMLYGYPFPAVYAIVDDQDHSWFLDGKQRLDYTAFEFIENKFRLTRSTPEFNGVKIAGKFFSDLPEEFQDIILGTTFQIYHYRNLSYAEIRELFSRLNNSVPLSAFEKVRIWVPHEVGQFVREIKQQGFFRHAVNIGDAAKKRKVDEEIIFQILLILRNNKEAMELKTKTVRQDIANMQEEKIAPSVLEEVSTTTAYLSKVLTERVFNLKKAHIMPVFITATYAIQDKLPPEQFVVWMDGFFKRSGGTNTAYGYATIIGSSNVANVQKRLDEMKKDYELFKDKPPAKVERNARQGLDAV